VAKKKKDSTRRFSFKLGLSKRKERARKAQFRNSLIFISIVLGVVCILAAAGIGFIFLEKYVKKEVPIEEKQAVLKLVDVPAWANGQLEEKIYTAARAGSKSLKLDDQAAHRVQRNIESQVAWLTNVKVQTTNEALLISAKWRKPLAIIKPGEQQFYVDEDLVVLDFVPVSNLPIVTVKGLSAALKTPAVGQPWRHDDLAAALAIIARLDRMDKLVTPDKPLLYEIESIDVSNFDGHQSHRSPHIVLVAKDGTQIVWGAEIGTWQRYLEAPDEEKLTSLYAYYKEYGSLLNGVRYINLRYSQESILQPVDKYLEKNQK
jgi:hypothetical protein